MDIGFLNASKSYKNLKNFVQKVLWILFQGHILYNF